MASEHRRRLLETQRLDGLRSRRARRDCTDRRERNRERYRRAADKRERAHLDAIHEARQPALHQEVGHRPRYDVREQHELAEVRREQAHDVPDGTAERFADADLLNAALGREPRKAEQAQARDRDREPEKNVSSCACRSSDRYSASKSSSRKRRTTGRSGTCSRQIASMRASVAVKSSPVTRTDIVSTKP